MYLKRMMLIFGLLALLAANVFATSYAVTPLEKLVNTSTAVVVATVTETHSEWNADQTAIYTYTTVQIDEVVAGKNVPQILTIRQLGGQVGDKQLLIDTRPEFTTGESTLLFLVWHRDLWWINSMGMGKFELRDKNGERVAQNSRISPDLLIINLPNKSSAQNVLEYDYSDLKREINRLNN